MTDDELKQLITSNAKSIAALASSLASESQERKKAYREWEKDRNQLYQYLGRIAAAQSNFYEVQSNFYEVQADYYHQLAALSERQANISEQLTTIQAQILQIFERLSLGDNP